MEKKVSIQARVNISVNFTERASVQVDADFLISKEIKGNDVYLKRIGEHGDFVCLSENNVKVLSGDNNFRSIPSDREDWICLEGFPCEKVYIQHSSWISDTKVSASK